MYNNFTEEARKVLIMAKEEMKDLRHPYVGSEHLLLSILKNKEYTKRFKKYKLTYDIFRNKLIEVVGTGSKESEWFLYTPLLKRILDTAIINSKENNSDVTIEHLISSLLEEGEGIAIRLLISLNIDIDSLYEEFEYKIVSHKKKKLLLEELGIDLTKKKSDPVIGRDEEIKRLIEILSRRTKNNPILIGDAGVGKTAIVEELSRMISNNEVPNSLKNKRIISLDMATTVAGTKYRGEFEERVRKILKEVEDNDDIILFIDEIHTLVGAGGAEGAIDASNIFKPALARNKLRCIGATTITEYKKFIEEDKALERRFQKIEIKVPSKDVTKKILLKLKPIYEQYHSVNISDSIIDKIIDLSERYIYDRNEPDKSIDILDEVCAKASLKLNKELLEYNDLTKKLNDIKNKKDEYVKNNDFINANKLKTKEFKIMDKVNNLELTLMNKKINEVDLNDVAYTISSKTKIPVYELLNENIDINLDDIVGQDKAKEELYKISKKIKLGYKDDKPYSLMFCGPSGVGKTFLAKLFGKNFSNSVIKLDMSEYSEPHSISKFIGSPPGYIGYNDTKNILEIIRTNPFSVLILDEIEKANESFINLLFQILDDGIIKDSKGATINFNNVIIIMTSNIGFNEIDVGFNKNNNQMTKLKENFSIPFINRIDNVIYFNNLNEEELKLIIKNKLKKLNKKYNNIKIKYDNNLINEIIELSDYNDFGARKIDKILKDKVESIVIDKLILNKKNIIIKSIKVVV